MLSVKNSSGWSLRTWMRLAVSASLLVVVAMPDSAVARARPAPSAAQSVATAAKLVVAIPGARYAPGRRRALLAAAAEAKRLTAAKRSCAALAATDGFLNLLRAPTTWKRRRIPTGSTRRPDLALVSAEAVLLRATGGRCARPARTHALRPRIGGAGAPRATPPNTPPEQGEGLDQRIPQGRVVAPKSLGTTSGLHPDLQGGPLAARDPTASIADTPLSFFRNSDVGVPPRSASPQEPTTAIAPAAGVAWYTGNTSVGLSTDNGRTWAMFDPSNVLPDQGLPYCCDQLVSYSPQYNVFVWINQYWCNTGSCLTTDSQGKTICRSDGAFNRIRIAVATPADLRANATNPGRAWTYWDVTPATIGQPANAWFDRSDMSVNPWNMNWGVDVLCGRGGGNLLARIPLAQLAARGTVTLSYILDNGARTTAQGLGTTTTYFAGANSAGQARIWSWAPFSSTLFRHDINHTTVPTYNSAIAGSDGSDWYDRYGIFPGEVESATVSGNTLYLAQGTGRAYCTANCNSNSPTLNQIFSEPAVFVSKFDVNSWTDVGERWLWNASLGFGFPALQTDGAGDVGIAMRASAEHHNAQPVAGFLTPSEQFYYAEPEGGPYETGDYYSLRPGRTSRSLVLTGQVVQNDPGGTRMHWFYIEYGVGTPPYVSPPSVHIATPANLTTFAQGATVGYFASVSDPIDGTLPAAAIVWTEDGSFIGTGSALGHVENKPGIHTITVTATNGDGKSASDTIKVFIQAPPPPGAPTASITSPANQSGFFFDHSNAGHPCANVPITATATDPGKLTLTYSWSDSVDGGAASIVSTALSPTLELCDFHDGFNTSSTHDLTLTVTNSAGKSTTAFLELYIFGPKLG